jgi:hypothetical protein
VKLLTKKDPPKPVKDSNREYHHGVLDEYLSRVSLSVREAKKYASVTNLAIIEEILRCCYTLIDARKDPDGSV